VQSTRLVLALRKAAAEMQGGTDSTTFGLPSLRSLFSAQPPDNLMPQSGSSRMSSLSIEASQTH
jgi:hypothetical protein